MSNVGDALRGRTPLGSVLKEGVDAIGEDQDIVFEPYIRLVLPLDGYVFWVKASTLSESAVFNSMMLGAAQFDQPQTIRQVPAPFIARGSLHYASNSGQHEAANYAVNQVIFTSEDCVQDMNNFNSNLVYIATFDGPDLQSGQEPAGTTAIRFAFSERGRYYQQSNLWHYIGNAIYPMMATQIVDDPRTLATGQLIVTNSLPAFLAFNYYNPPWPVPVPRPLVTMYPSFLTPDNQKPPYIAVHIEPTGTTAVQSRAYLSDMTDQYLNATDRVTLTFYGCDNAVALSMQYALEQYSLDSMPFGFVGDLPVLRDEKETQNELTILAQKKTMSFSVNYNQGVVRNIARQLITSCVPTVFAGDEEIIVEG